ncbi:MAG: hypothetical protein K6G24_09675 [Lachnospiraceae bacterium]|nr:hypothetical protein [Lachnospiraceae bacterium]
METLYWLLQYFWVLIAFGFIMFVWPMVVFKKHLNGKSKTYRFSFCSVVMIVIINTACILLGLLHILNQVVFCLVFYGFFLFFLLRKKTIPQNVKKKFKNLIGGTYGPKTMFLDIMNYIRNKIKSLWSLFLRVMKGHWFEYSLLGIVILFGFIYFSYGALSDYSFGCGDIYVHTEWIYNLFNGTIFFDGIYPEGMHFFIFSETALCGVPMYSAILFTGCIVIFVTLVALYILLREVFRWKYTPILAMMFFLTIDATTSNEIYTLARMQWSLPQEFGYPAMFLCAAYLIRFLRYSVVKKDKINRDAEKKRITIPIVKKTIRITVPLCLKEENLMVFTLALAATIVIHFYATIMAFFLCLGIAVALLRKVFTRKFLPLAIGVMTGAMIAIVPLVVSFLCGIRLQGSLYWAMSVFSPKEEEPEQIDPETEAFEDAIKDLKTEQKEEEYTGIVSPSATKTIDGSVNILAMGIGILDRVRRFTTMLREVGYEPIHGIERGDFYYHAMWVALLVGIVACIYRFIYRKIKKCKDDEEKSYIGYIILVGMGVVCHLFNCSSAMGLPCIMEPYRICALAMLMSVVTLVVPFDFLFSLFDSKINKIVSGVIATCLILAIYIGCRVTGNYRGYLVYQLTRYNSAVMVTKQIVNTLPKDSYTIVSSTDELYQILGHGFHEELIEFINESEVVSYTVPTDYIFIYVEKNAIYRNQDHFFTGPSWLAQNGKYYEKFPGKNSEAENLRKQTISEDVANVYFGKFPHSINVYGLLWQRVLLNSKMYVWCQKFNAMYPNELHVYYEDDDFLCYYLHQNPRNLYELAAMDPSVMVAPEDYSNPIWPEDYAEGLRREKERLKELEEEKKKQEQEEYKDEE